MTTSPRSPVGSAGPPGSAALKALYLSAFLRSASAGLAGILLGLHLSRQGFTPSIIGLVVSAGFTGAAVGAAFAMFRADRVGRRLSLVGIAVVSAAGLAAAATFSSAPVVMAVAFFGMVNGMGRDRGAALLLEQTAITDGATASTRTRAFALYSFAQDLGHGIGSLLAALTPSLATPSDASGTRGGLFVASALIAAAAVCYAFIAPGVQGSNEPRKLSAASRAILTRVSFLFALDSLGGGFLSSAWISIFFYERFGMGEAVLGPLFFLARVANAVSHLAAAWLARRIGLVNTMVFTHLPSSLLLLTVAFAPSFPIAAVLFLLREGLVEMDVPTRQSYVMAVVDPADRTLAAGVTQLVRMAGWAMGPALAGWTVEGSSIAAPVILGAALKIAYDIALYRSFIALRPPEERSDEFAKIQDD